MSMSMIPVDTTRYLIIEETVTLTQNSAASPYTYYGSKDLTVPTGWKVISYQARDKQSGAPVPACGNVYGNVRVSGRSASATVIAIAIPT